MGMHRNETICVLVMTLYQKKKTEDLSVKSTEEHIKATHFGLQDSVRADKLRKRF